MNASMKSKVVACLAVASLAASPAAMATTHTNSSARKQAEKYCRALLKKEGGRNFEKQYGPKNAMGKCVSTYEKTHPSTNHGKRSHGSKGKKKGHSK